MGGFIAMVVVLCIVAIAIVVAIGTRFLPFVISEDSKRHMNYIQVYTVSNIIWL